MFDSKLDIKFSFLWSGTGCSIFTSLLIVVLSAISIFLLVNICVMCSFGVFVVSLANAISILFSGEILVIKSLSILMSSFF